METSNGRPMKKSLKLEDMSKEQIRQAILRKKECNARAQEIVENLLEAGVSEDYLLKCLPDINQVHFEDVFEERSILHLCGYPICLNTISDKDIPKQKYRISLKTNKVYDITVRKNFCSNSCYKLAMYVKQQMLTSPLWFREHEVIPTFHLLPLDSSGSMGQEVDLGLLERVDVKSDEKSAFLSINDFANATLTDMTMNDVPEIESEISKDKNETISKTQEQSKINLNESTTSQSYLSKKTQEQSKININESTTSQSYLSNNSTESTIKEQQTQKVGSQSKPIPNLTNIVGEIIEKSERKIDPILTQVPKIIEERKSKNVSQKKQSLVTALAIEVEKCLAQWFTLDTILFLFGEEKVRAMVTDKGECISKYLNNYAKGVFYNSNAYDQYQQLCRKLNMLELEDKRSDAKRHRQMQPLPDYKMLQEESKRMQLKVRAYIAGETEIPKSEAREDTVDDDGNVTHLPLVDKNAQNALRRKIVSQYLNKVLPDLLRSLGLLTLTINSDVRLLVNTFKLKANNIMFKPIQWMLIALIFIKLLSIRDKRLEHLLKQAMAYQHMQLLLLSYKLDGGYLDRLISWLTDIDRLLDTSDTHFTSE